MSLSLAAVQGGEETLCTAVGDFVGAAQLTGASAVRCDGSFVRLAVAPDAATAETLVA